MRVLLISANVTISPYPIYPLGLSMVAAALEKGGHEVRQADFLLHGTSIEAIAGEVRDFAPGLIGISVRNIDNVNLMNEKYYIENVRNIVSAVREVSNAKVLLGGSGFSLVPELILEATGADFGIIGEGEQLAIEFVDNAEKGVFPEQRLIGPAEPMQGGDIGPAAYDDRLLSFYLGSGNIASIQTKRGCAYKCVYCTYPLLEGADLRKRDPREVVDDMLALRNRHDSAYIFFVDSVFNDDEGAYLEVVDEMLRRGVNIPWTAFIKPGGLTDEIVERMKKTGFAAAEVGTDAACDRTLKSMGKNFTFSQVVECNDLLARHGIATSHFFMFGGPGETEDTVQEGIQNILSLKKCVSFIFMGIRILPGTPLARLAVKEGVISADNGLLEPTYYLSPSIDRDWLEKRLTEAFADVRHCIFPPDAMEGSLQVLHKLGYTGPLWDMLIPGERTRKRKKGAPE